MSLFEAVAFLDDPVFVLFLIGCGFCFRAGSVLLDWLIDNVRWLWQGLRKNR